VSRLRASRRERSASKLCRSAVRCSNDVNEATKFVIGQLSERGALDPHILRQQARYGADILRRLLLAHALDSLNAVLFEVSVQGLGEGFGELVTAPLGPTWAARIARLEGPKPARF
jgi:hypothetical protein